MSKHPSQPIEPDPESVENWERLPQNTPSKDALPPMMGGSRAALMFVVLLLVLAALALLFGQPPA